MKVIAHRGASGYCPENTMASFKKALEMGVESIELDVQMTKDGQLIIMHDFYLDRTTNGSGLIMNAMYDEVKRLDAGSWYSDLFVGERVPRLEEVLALVPNSVHLYIEIKKVGFDQRSVAPKVLEMVEAYKRMGHVTFSSFDHSELQTIGRLQDVPIGVLVNMNLLDVTGYVKAHDLKPMSINQSAAYINPQWVEAVHRKGYKSFVYTVNDLDLAKLCEAMGVDGLFTNYPDIMTT